MKATKIKYQRLKNRKSKIQSFGFSVSTKPERVILIFSLCLLHFLTGCGRKTTKVKESAVPVEAAVAQKMQLEQTLQFTGDVKGKDQVRIYPKVTGKLIEYKVKEGAYVEKQDVIALIDRDITGF
ncbi:MAG: hypothetical protein KAV18_03825, partial [Candidatus Omnitrophica bacterium]|nr:hypothetical protein [Candidatus Omnitrophota bacterium]